MNALRYAYACSWPFRDSSRCGESRHIVPPPPQPRGGQTALAGKGPDLAKGSNLAEAIDHTGHVQEVLTSFNCSTSSTILFTYVPRPSALHPFARATHALFANEVQRKR